MQLAGGQQPHQPLGVAPIGLDAIASARAGSTPARTPGTPRPPPPACARARTRSARPHRSRAPAPAAPPRTPPPLAAARQPLHPQLARIALQHRGDHAADMHIEGRPGLSLRHVGTPMIAVRAQATPGPQTRASHARVPTLTPRTGQARRSTTAIRSSARWRSSIRRAQARARAAPSAARARSRRPAPRAPRCWLRRARRRRSAAARPACERASYGRAHIALRALDRPLEGGRRLRRAVEQQLHRPDAVGDRAERAGARARAPPRHRPYGASSGSTRAASSASPSSADHVRDLGQPRDEVAVARRRREAVRAHLLDQLARGLRASACRCAHASAGRQPGGALSGAPAAQRAARAGPARRARCGAKSVMAPWNLVWIGESSRPSASPRSPALEHLARDPRASLVVALQPLRASRACPSRWSSSAGCCDAAGKLGVACEVRVGLVEPAQLEQGARAPDVRVGGAGDPVRAPPSARSARPRAPTGPPHGRDASGPAGRRSAPPRAAWARPTRRAIADRLVGDSRAPRPRGPARGSCGGTAIRARTCARIGESSTGSRCSASSSSATFSVSSTPYCSQVPPACPSAARANASAAPAERAATAPRAKVARASSHRPAPPGRRPGRSRAGRARPGRRVSRAPQPDARLEESRPPRRRRAGSGPLGGAHGVADRAVGLPGPRGAEVPGELLQPRLEPVSVARSIASPIRRCRRARRVAESPSSSVGAQQRVCERVATGPVATSAISAPRTAASSTSSSSSSARPVTGASSSRSKSRPISAATLSTSPGGLRQPADAPGDHVADAIRHPARRRARASPGSSR